MRPGSKRFMILAALIAVGILMALAVLIQSSRQPQIITPSPSPSPITITSTPPSPTTSPTPTITTTTTISPTSTQTTPTMNRVNIFFVALEDNGQRGRRIGCGDSLVPVAINIQPTTTPLRVAFEQLLSVRTQFFGQSGLYNSLYQSDLRVDRAVIENGRATVNLSGTVSLGGTCDNPRFEQQLRQTALQFPTISSANITINGRPLEEIVSSR